MGNPTTHDWVRLEVLILRRACTLLRKQFRRRWKQTQNQEWKDTPEFGKAFISGLGSQIYQSCGRLHKMTLEEGDVNNWDFTLLTRILKQTNFLPATNEAENKQLEELISYSKQAIEHPTKTLGDLEFASCWDHIEAILVSLGENEKELEELKRSESVSEEDLISLSGEDFHQMDENCLKEAKTLREAGRNLVNAGNYLEALKSLNAAIALQFSLPDLELGALYALRSDAYLRLTQSTPDKKESMELAYKSLKDSKQALFLRPAWGLAHYRVGMAYVELGKFKKASKYLDQALDLEPSMEEIKMANNTCKIKLVQLADDFASNLPTFQQVNFQKPNPLPGGTRLNKGVMDKIDMLFDAEDENNILGTVYKAHKLRDGINTKQSYKDAAILYKKGVKSRNAEAMYNLALLKLEGKGIKQDVKGAINLLKRASSKLCAGSGLNFTSNVGVVESSFVLGLLAHEGIGFPPQVDTFSASVYYQEASEHGHGPAAHNLGILHSRGQGVVKNEKRAVQLWKLGASRGVPESMFALAFHYAKEWETAEARKWFDLAITEYYEGEGLNYCQIHNNLVEDEEDLDENEVKGGWKPSPKLSQEFNAALNTIDNWRARYGQKEISRWEISHGLRSTSQNLPMKQRLSKMLHVLDHEKEKIGGIEDYFSQIKPCFVIIPFENAKIWARNARREMFVGGNYSEGEDSQGQQSSRSVSSVGSDEYVDNNTITIVSDVSVSV